MIQMYTDPDFPFRDHPIKANRSIALAWERFVSGGKCNGQSPRQAIFRGWERSRDLGIDPGAQRAPMQLAPDEIEIVLAKDPIGLAGKEVLQHYSDLVSDIGHVIMLGDANGRLLHAVGAEPVRNDLERVNFLPGACWSEDLVGPNGIGTPLALKRPELVFGTEHYCQGWQPWVCYGSPILDPGTGRVVGAVDISGEARCARIETMALTIAIAGTIQNKLQIYDLQKREFLRQRLYGLERRHSLDAVLIVNENWRLVDLNRAATYLLDTRTPLLLGRALSELLPELWNAVQTNLQSLKPGECAVSLGRSGESFKLRIEPITRDGSVLGMALILSRRPARASREEPRPSVSNNDPDLKKHQFENLVGSAPAFLKAVHLARAASRDPRDNTVLLLGESGTGKELIAQAIHAASSRSAGPMVEVNCAALPTGLAESELFGYSHGAFTGAQRGGAIGKFEAANGGTLFLDEIDSMPLELQAKLLRVVENREFTRVGEIRPRRVNVRIVSAANTRIRDRIASGEFRGDLFHRLGIIEILLPPLRQRIGDIEPLTCHFLESYCIEMDRSPLQVAPDVMERLISYGWPGNVRELRNLCARWVLVVNGNLVNTDDVPAHILTAPSLPMTRRQPADMDLRKVNDEIVKTAIAEAGGCISAAARALGVDRTTIYRRMKRWNRPV